MRFSKFRIFLLQIITRESLEGNLSPARPATSFPLVSINLDPVSDSRPTGSRFRRLRHGKHGECQLPEIFATMCQDDLSRPNFAKFPTARLTARNTILDMLLH